ncbi:MAG: Cof-type HAD-IIB family hydrolase [Propionibacteriaceae bacterium]|nr:Cof-type HAD-IIB family hydrolase [Propionibacteriaceae bacterium]
MKLIAFDLDGTFLADDKSIPEVNQRAVSLAASRSIPVVVSTGRPARWLGAIDSLHGHHQLMVTSNGAAIYDWAAGRTVSAHALDAGPVLEAIAAVRAAIPGITFGVETSFDFGCEPDAPIQQFSDWEAWPADIAEIIARCSPIIKLLGFHADYTSDELVRIAGPIVGDAMQTTHASVGEPFGLVEFTAPGVTKATGLAEICELLGVAAADVVAFGDMPNDLEMLAWAGRGFAMANSHPALRDAGFEVVADNNAGGVGAKLFELLQA